MNYYLLIPFFIILILFVPIRLQLKLSFNVLDFSGALGFFVFKKQVEHQQFWIKGKKILSKRDNEIESKEIEFDSKEVIFYETFAEQIKDKTRLKELYIFYNIGFNDAFLSAMITGYINSAINILFGRIKNKKPTSTLAVFDTISYNREVCQFALKTILSISLFDIVYSLLMSVILSKKIHAQKQKSKELSKKQNTGYKSKTYKKAGN